MSKRNSITIESLYEMVLSKIDLSRETDDEELRLLIDGILEECGKQHYLSLQDKVQYSKDLFHSFRRFDVLQELIEDDQITEIMINGTEPIFLEKAGQLFQSDKRFFSEGKLEDVIQQIVAGTNRYVNESSPIVDARLPDGSRVNVVMKPIALNGPIMTIRKFPKEKTTMNQLVAWGSISLEAAQFLEFLVKAQYNIFVSGGTGSGKTTFLNALSDFIPADERVITIEDNAELQIKTVKNLVRLETRNANLEGEGAISIRELIRSALRMRPTRIIVGEVRGEETVDMISSAMLNGHSGSMSTGHANSATDMIGRIETMMMMGIEMPLAAISRQVAAGLDIIVHLGRIRDRSRKVLEVVEVLSYENDQIQLQTLFEFQEKGVKNGKVEGELMKVSDLKKRDKLLAAGYHL